MERPGGLSLIRLFVVPVLVGLMTGGVLTTTSSPVPDRLIAHVVNSRDDSVGPNPLALDWLDQAGTELAGAGATAKAAFGGAAALSANGTTAIVGAPDDGGGVGAAWVFTRSGSEWTAQGTKLNGSGELGHGGFGAAVALSANGNTALIGGDGVNDSLFGGSAWVFTRSGTSWTQQGPKLTVDGAQGFGSAVALSANGNTALIGEQDYGDSGEFSGPGAAWVFTRSGSMWTAQSGRLIPPEGGSVVPSGGGPGGFGSAVALSADGNTALIGSPALGYEGSTSSRAGGAWVFTRSGLKWTRQVGFLYGSGAVMNPSSGDLQPFFGDAVALSADGNTALVGGDGDNSGVGAAWVFTRTGSKWIQQGSKLVGRGESGDGGFGVAVAVSADGNIAVIGGSGDRQGTGAAWIFTRSHSQWTQRSMKLRFGGESGKAAAGTAVAVSSGGTALIGAPADHAGRGSAWAFSTAG